MEDTHPAGIEVTSVRLLEMIESAYPNPLSISEMAKYEPNHILKQIVLFIESVLFSLDYCPLILLILITGLVFLNHILLDECYPQDEYQLIFILFLLLIDLILSHIDLACFLNDSLWIK